MNSIVRLFGGPALLFVALATASSASATSGWYLLIPPSSDFNERAPYLQGYNILDTKPLSQWEHEGVLAIRHASYLCRMQQGIDRRLFLGIETHHQNQLHALGGFMNVSKKLHDFDQSLLVYDLDIRFEFPLRRRISFILQEMMIMQLKTRINGGEASFQEVADAWKKEDHNYPWSKLESDKRTVEFIKRLKELRRNAEPPTPDPRNIHED